MVITEYELWLDAGDDTLSTFSQITDYQTFYPTFTLTQADHSLSAIGTIYRVKFRAVNENGQASLFSNELIFALGPLPQKPNAPTKNIILSGPDSIMVEWDKNVGDDLAVIGYNLYADTGLKDELVLIFDGKNLAETNSKLITAESLNVGSSLSNLLFYRFQVSAINFNGESERSDISLL